MQRTHTLRTTFDSASELVKIHKHHPGAHCLLRIRADDPNARCKLGNKYGAEMREVRDLLASAQALNLAVDGVSFHVGSGASDPQSFLCAIYLAREVFNIARDELGIQTMRMVDLGGGYSGGSGDGMKALAPVAKVINEALDACFPAEASDAAGGMTRYTIIAEPGRYFAEAACSLFASVYGKRERCFAPGGGKDGDGDGHVCKEYWLTDGLYGSMNCLLYDHAELTAVPIKFSQEKHKNKDGSDLRYNSTLFGPTCDGLDTVMKDVMLPNLEMGDWVKFPSMGAYTLSASSNFNGIQATDANIFYVASKQENKPSLPLERQEQEEDKRQRRMMACCA